MRSKPCALSAESYRVYDAVIEDYGIQQHAGQPFGPLNLVVLNVAKLSGGIAESFWPSRKKNRPADETIAGFNNLVGCSCTMDPPPDSLIHFKFISENELRTIFAGGVESGWTKFYHLYPKSRGYWDFSPVGFNKAGDQALVYVGHHCGGLCGTGSYVVLQKKDDRWSVKNWRVALVS